MPRLALSIQTSILELSVRASLSVRPRFGQKTVTFPVSGRQGGLFLFEAEAQSVGLAALPFCAAEVPSARHSKTVIATKRRLGKALPGRISCFIITGKLLCRNRRTTL